MRVGIVVPVHNEELLLAECLSHLLIAARECPVPSMIALVLDRCTDSSERIARSFDCPDLVILDSDRPGVGSARAIGMSALLDRCDPAELWLATTDADSTVPSNWLAGQLAHAEHGADVVVGTVTVQDWSEHSACVRSRFLSSYQPQAGHRHMHGANLSFRARAYQAAGGFAEHEFDEDVDLIRRFERCGQSVVWAADLPVVTSARRTGRAPNGFAGHLIGLEEAP